MFRKLCIASLPGSIAVALVAVGKLSTASPSLWWLLLAGLAYVAADLFTGFVHFLADNFGRLDTAFGRALVVRFREHHDDPDDILQDDAYDLFGPTLIFAIPTLILSTVALDGAMLWFALCFVVASSFANPIHKWAHMEDPGPVISWLQKRKIVMPPAQHDFHHLQANTHYCTVAGWFDGWFLRKDVPYRLRELLTRMGMRRS